TIYLIDGGNCKDTLQVNVNATNAPVINDVNVINSSCGQSDGSITIEAIGGVGTLQYSIDGIVWQNSPVFNGLPAGTYPVFVRDSENCTSQSTATIQDIGAPVISAVNVVETSCGGSDGSITILATGNSTLQYSIDCIQYQTSNTFPALTAGNYVICVKDQNGCIASQPVTMNTLDGPRIDDINVEHTECGNGEGYINVESMGGTGDHTYFIDGVNVGTDPHIGPLPAGTYTVEVRDENGCSASDVATILPSEGPDFDAYVTPSNCGMANGLIDLDGFDGIRPYQYSIDGSPFGPVFTFPNLVSEFYIMRIRDAKGCIYEDEVFVWDVPGPQITAVTLSDPDCDSINGTIIVVATGTGTLMYSLNPPFFQDSGSFHNVMPGTHIITVEDEAGCPTTATAVIEFVESPEIDNIIIADTECGEDEGMIQVFASGGTPPLMYSLNNGQFTTNPVFTLLPAGNYLITVKGDNGCLITADVTINSLGEEEGDLSTSICANDTFTLDGQIFTNAGDYDITIPGGAVNGCDSTIHLHLMVNPLLEKINQQTICTGDTLKLNGIDYSTAGMFVIDTLEGGVNCDTIETLVLILLPLENTIVNATICRGDSIFIGGNYYKDEGDYFIDTIPGISGCDSIRTLHLEVNELNTTTIDASICQGEVYTINGINYTVAGTYLIDTIAAVNGCDTIRRLELEVNPLPIADAGQDQTLQCLVPTVLLNGTATGGLLTWTGPGITSSNEHSLTPSISIPGEYILTVVSPSGCINTDTVQVVADPGIIIADAGEPDFFSCDIDTVILHANPTGPGISYQWTGPGINSNNDNLQDPIILVPGTYTLVVTDNITGCVSAPDTVIITDITTNIIAIIQDPLGLTCFSTFVDLTTMGSSTGENIVYFWIDDEGNVIGDSPIIEVNTVGEYMFIVKDTLSGCFDDDTVTVQDLSIYPPVDAGDPQVIDCNNPTVTLNAGAVNSNDHIVFHWSGPAGGILSPDSLLSVLVALPGTYTLMAEDTVFGCKNEDDVIVTDMTQMPAVDIDILEQITCIDETALLDIGSSATGQNISYEWNGPSMTGVNTNSIVTTQPGYYYLLVRNAATGCESLDSALIVLPEQINDIDFDITIPLCQGEASGKILINDVLGGAPKYVYSLNGVPSGTNIFEGLLAGTYSVSVTDANGCTYLGSVTIPDETLLTIDIGPDIEMNLGDSIQLDAAVNIPWNLVDSIVWASGEHLSCTHCIDPILYGLINETITATVYAGGCIDQDQLALRVIIDVDIYIPNVFTPNDDGINDHVTIFTDENVRKVLYLEIFDRWGNLVFRATDFAPNDPLLGWDGSFKNKPMNPGVFAYIARVELINGAVINRKGDITLLR
nr:gliding motility-associated C-terminal domain-containing protein [Bacteroidota bacterium]